MVDEKGPLGFSPWNVEWKNDCSKYTSGIAGGAPACTTAGFDVYGSVGVVIGGAGWTVGADRFDFPRGKGGDN